MKLVPALLLISALVSSGQTASSRRVVRAVGDASISVKPDVAKVSIGVVTRAATAQEASAQNATQVENVLTRLRQVLGSAAELKTVNYSLNPEYRYTTGNAPVLLGFVANNTVEATVENMSLIGRVIDAAIEAGANTVQSLRFTIKDPEPVRLNALGLAAKQARAHAEAIASGLGARIGVVLTAQEGAVYNLRELTLDDAATAAKTTPIETGLVQVYATVTVEAELL